MRKKIIFVFLIIVIFYTAGCGGSFLLPRSEDMLTSPWQTYQKVAENYDKIEPYRTTEKDLKELNIYLYAPNTRILNYLSQKKLVLQLTDKDLQYLDYYS